MFSVSFSSSTLLSFSYIFPACLFPPFHNSKTVNRVYCVYMGKRFCIFVYQKISFKTFIELMVKLMMPSLLLFTFLGYSMKFSFYFTLKLRKSNNILHWVEMSCLLFRSFTHVSTQYLVLVPITISPSLSLCLPLRMCREHDRTHNQMQIKSLSCYHAFLLMAVPLFFFFFFSLSPFLIYSYVYFSC